MLVEMVLNNNREALASIGFSDPLEQAATSRNRKSVGLPTPVAVLTGPLWPCGPLGEAEGCIEEDSWCGGVHGISGRRARGLIGDPTPTSHHNPNPTLQPQP